MISPQRRLLLIGSASGAVVIGMATLAGAAVIDTPHHFNTVEATSTTAVANSASTTTSTLAPVEVEAPTRQPRTVAEQPATVVAVTLADSAPLAPPAASTTSAPSSDSTQAPSADDEQGDDEQGDDDQADDDQADDDQADDDDAQADDDHADNNHGSHGDHDDHDDDEEVENDD